MAKKSISSKKPLIQQKKLKQKTKKTIVAKIVKQIIILKPIKNIKNCAKKWRKKSVSYKNIHKNLKPKKYFFKNLKPKKYFLKNIPKQKKNEEKICKLRKTVN